MITVKSNIPDVVKDLMEFPSRLAAAKPSFFEKKVPELYDQGRDIVEQVVYAAFPEGDYVRRGTTTGDLGILNSVVSFRSEQGMVLGITSPSSRSADTIPVTPIGQSFSDTYAAYMITGGGFLEPLGTDVRNFLEVWAQFFSVTLPSEYLEEVVIPSV